MRAGSVLTALLIPSTALLPGCDPGHSKDEVKRVVSPNGRVEAVLYETNGGATTSFGYEVDLRKVGDDKATKVADIYGAIRNEKAYGVNMVWSQPNVLKIEFLRSKGVVTSVPTATVEGQQIAVSLDAGINDPSAPDGEMLYNLRKK